MEKKIIWNFENLDMSDEDKAKFVKDFKERQEKYCNRNGIIKGYTVEFTLTDSEK